LKFDVAKIRNDFPALHQTIYGKPLVYLDNAATSQKPKVVIDAISQYYSTINSNVHRGVHYLSQQATDAFEKTRNHIQQFINARHSHEIIITKGATDSINLVANSFGKKFLNDGDERLACDDLRQIWRNPLLGIWQSNLGAISMAQSELVNWPTGRWNGNPDLSVYQSARERFLYAVKIAPHNRTAHHRLGLIALQGRQYPEARDQLNEAYRIDSDHRGIQKSAGYANVWTGSFDQAAELLVEIPEAIYELNEYNIWWKRQGRIDLASQATQMEEILKGMSTPNLYQRENQP